MVFFVKDVKVIDLKIIALTLGVEFVFSNKFQYEQWCVLLAEDEKEEEDEREE